MMLIFKVLVPKKDALLGLMLDVVITSAGKHYMKADIISTTEELELAAFQKSEIKQLNKSNDSMPNGRVNQPGNDKQAVSTTLWEGDEDCVGRDAG